MKYLYLSLVILLTACTGAQTLPVDDQVVHTMTNLVESKYGLIPPDTLLALQQAEADRLREEAEADMLRKESGADSLPEQSEADSLQKQSDESPRSYEQYPRQVFVSARTREYKYADYMREWVKKVERVGNLNYPDQARREGLTGKLRMDVTLNADGVLLNTNITQSSGHPVLDEAALRIVNQAAPFLPFPPEILKDADILHITRTWVFTTEHHGETDRQKNE